MFTFDGPDTTDGQAWLDGLFPRTGLFAWLKLVWMPGDRFWVPNLTGGFRTITRPVQRLVVYQMTERPFIPEFILEGLQGPHPRTLGFWNDKTDSWETESVVSLQQWDLFRATGCYGTPFWVIQGNHGGHKRRYAPAEQDHLQMLGLPTDPPAPGDLEFAPFDWRVVRQLLIYDRLRRTETNLRDPKKRVARWQRERVDAERAFRADALRWIEELAHNCVSDAKNGGGILNFEALPDGDHYFDRTMEADEEAFLSQTDNAPYHP